MACQDFSESDALPRPPEPEGGLPLAVPLGAAEIKAALISAAVVTAALISADAGRDPDEEVGTGCASALGAAFGLPLAFDFGWGYGAGDASP